MVYQPVNLESQYFHFYIILYRRLWLGGSKFSPRDIYMAISDRIETFKRNRHERMSSLKFIVDLGGDGRVTVVDFVAWQLLIVFCGVSGAALYVFADRLLTNAFGTSTEKIATYSIPLSQVMGTLATLVYTFAFMYSATEVCTDGKSSWSFSTFLDINKDGSLSISDWMCCLTGITHVSLVLVNVYLFFDGNLRTAEVVTLITANTRLIILFLSNSFMAHMSDQKKKSGWRFIFDIYHDDAFQLVDLLAMICTIIFVAAGAFCYSELVFRPVGQSDVVSLISLTGQCNLILISAFARVYLSKGDMSAKVEVSLSVYAVIYMVLLLRTVGEMSTVPAEDTFSVITSLANKMVLGVTQLVMGSYVVHDTTRKKM